MLSFEPMRDRIIIQRKDKTTKTTGGLLLTEMSTKQSDMGEVVSVGAGEFSSDGETLKPMSLNVGDTVLFPIQAGTDIVLDGEEYVIMREGEVYGTITDE